MTVTFSRLGCQWGAILYPEGIFRRTVKSPELAVGSPSSTATCAPAATNGGGGPHLIWSGLKVFCGTADATMQHDAAASKPAFQIFLIGSPWRNGFFSSAA